MTPRTLHFHPASLDAMNFLLAQPRRFIEQFPRVFASGS
jgi:hypothetical protein